MIENKSEYYSCNIIEHGFDAQFNSINLCCRAGDNKNTKRIVILPNYHGEEIDWDEFFKKKEDFKNIQKTGKTIPYCQNCIYLEKRKWEDEKYINSININNWIKCNAKCIYCDRKNYLQFKEYPIYPLIQGLIKNGYLKNPVDITIAGGEPTITNDFDKVLKLLIQHNYSTIRVLTNAIKYNKYIEEGISKRLVNIFVSTDSGTDKTYKIIKSVNKHKEVWKNIKRYCEFQQDEISVQTKYIIIPNINDNEKEIFEFINRNKEANVKNTYIDVEISAFYKNSENTNFLNNMQNLFLFAKQLGKNTDIKVHPFDRIKIIQEKLNKKQN